MEFCVHFHKIGNRRADWRDSSREAIQSLVVFFMEMDKCKSCLNTEFCLVCYYLGFDMLKNGVPVPLPGPALVKLFPFFWFFHLFNRISIFAFFTIHLNLLFISVFAYFVYFFLCFFCSNLHIHFWIPCRICISILVSIVSSWYLSSHRTIYSSLSVLIIWKLFDLYRQHFEIVRPRRN